MQAQHLMYSGYGELSKINTNNPEKDCEISLYLVARNQKIHLDLSTDFATRGTGPQLTSLGSSPPTFVLVCTIDPEPLIYQRSKHRRNYPRLKTN